METPESYLNGKNGSIEEWGKGILQNRKDYLTLMALDEAAGLKELVARPGVTSPPPTSDSNIGLPNRFSIHADFNYGTGSIPMTRKYLDSGVLADLIDENMAKIGANNDEATYSLVILGTSAMSIGCTLPDSFKVFLQKSSSTFKISTVAKYQLKKALSTYTNGTAHNFGNMTLVEWMSGGRMPGAKVESYSVGWQKFVEVNNPGGVLAMCGPPTPEVRTNEWTPVRHMLTVLPICF